MNSRLSVTAAIAAAALSITAITVPAVGEMAAASQQAAETVLHSGSWTKKSFASKGGWSIVESDGKHYVVLSDDFSTRKAPDLKIFLSPLEADAATGKNAADGSTLIAPLASNKGGQRYEIPADVNLDDFKSILIHCEQYAKLWSASAL